MHILCIIPYPLNAPTYPNRIHPLLSNIILAGEQVDVLVYYLNLPFRSRPALLKNPRSNAVSRSKKLVTTASPFMASIKKVFQKIGILNIGFTRFFFSISSPDSFNLSLRALKTPNDKYDIIYVSKPWIKSSFVGISLAKKWNVPIVLDCDDYDIYPSSNLLKKFNGIVVSSQELLGQFHEYDPLYLPNSTNLELFDINRFPRDNSSTPTIIWSGIMYDFLALDDIVVAFSHMTQNGKLVFSGAGPKERKLRKLVNKLGIDDKVRFAGWAKDKAAVPPRLAQADIGVVYTVDTLYERCKNPGKLYEYMAMKLPVVATNVGEAAKIVEEAECGITVAPNNPRAMAEAFDTLASNSKLRKEMGENGKKYLEEKLNYNILASKLLEYFYRVSKKKQNQF